MTKKTTKRNQNDTAKHKKKQIKISSLNSLKKIRFNVAGIDVGSEFNYVAAPDPQQEGKIVINRFGSFTSNLIECVESLKQCNIKSVAMEATGVYWTTLYSMIEEAGIEVIVINPRDFKKMKDKKTDVCDAEYLQLYHCYGLLEGSVIPEKKILEVRTYTRLREQSVREAATGIQRMRKALIRMNLRLDNVLSDISGETGMRIIRDIVRGERDPKKLALYRDKRCKKSLEEIEESLKGFYQEEDLFALERAVREYDFNMNEVRRCDEKIQMALKEFESHKTYKEKSKEEMDELHPSENPKKSTKKSHKFTFNLKQEIARITGVDLTLLPGIGEHTALTLISETGLDMSRWKSAKHFASWLRLSANNKVSGGKVLQKGTKRKKNKAAVTLRMSVSGLYSEVNDTAIGAFFRKKRAQLGPAKAITAAANKLARMYYMTLSTGKPFEEMGVKKYLELQKKKYLKRVRSTIRPWGLDIVQLNKSEQEINATLVEVK
jgi:transposase